MKDEDLERLLQDVDGDSDFKGVGEESPRMDHTVSMGDAATEEGEVIDPVSDLVEYGKSVAGCERSSPSKSRAT